MGTTENNNGKNCEMKKEEMILKNCDFQISATRTARLHYLTFLITINLAYFGAIFFVSKNGKTDLILVLSFLLSFINMSLFFLYIRDEKIAKDWEDEKKDIIKKYHPNIINIIANDKFSGLTIFIVCFLFTFFTLLPLYIACISWCPTISFWCIALPFIIIHLGLFFWIYCYLNKPSKKYTIEDIMKSLRELCHKLNKVKNKNKKGWEPGILILLKELRNKLKEIREEKKCNSLKYKIEEIMKSLRELCDKLNKVKNKKGWESEILILLNELNNKLNEKSEEKKWYPFKKLYNCIKSLFNCKYLISILYLVLSLVLIVPMLCFLYKYLDHNFCGNIWEMLIRFFRNKL